MTRPLTQKRLKNIALFYLEHYEATASKLKSVLLRRAQKSLLGEPVPTEVHKWVQQIVADCQNLGYVNLYNRKMIRLNRFIMMKRKIVFVIFEV